MADLRHHPPFSQTHLHESESVSSLPPSPSNRFPRSKTSSPSKYSFKFLFDQCLDAIPKIFVFWVMYFSKASDFISPSTCIGKLWEYFYPLISIVGSALVVLYWVFISDDGFEKISPSPRSQYHDFDFEDTMYGFGHDREKLGQDFLNEPKVVMNGKESVSERLHRPRFGFPVRILKSRKLGSRKSNFRGGSGTLGFLSQALLPSCGDIKSRRSSKVSHTKHHSYEQETDQPYRQLSLNANALLVKPEDVPLVSGYASTLGKSTKEKTLRASGSLKYTKAKASQIAALRKFMEDSKSSSKWI